MKNLQQPIFGNTCGKLYEEYIVLASANREKTLPLNSIKSIALSSSISLNSLLFMLLPLMLLLLPQLMGKEDGVIKISFYVMGCLFLVLSIIKAQRKYRIKIITSNGGALKIRVARENLKDAQKFTASVSKQLLKNDAKSKAILAEERLASAVFSTANVLPGK
ncbi:hypothetical protein GR160_18685 [Flavobacterium sp. Sd200]|uniref:hypothetical protein n=1 Tax=Flavobacterium sp. Sd200 TaxID=2692211 RepID=UPI001368A8F4|nr:hypothetical protein [Flavobacterium sp. Sd200]MXN93259.1 hypothetical protein [Flavobacterium sp. Sd200]